MRLALALALAGAALCRASAPGASADEESCHQPLDDPGRADLRPVRTVDARADCAAPAALGEAHILEFKPEADTFLVLRNGESSGKKVRLANAQSCMRTLARFAVNVPGPKYLYTSAGLPVRTMDDVADNHIVFALSAWETWVWPGVRVNHTMVIEGVKFTTVSMQPRAFLLENLFTHEFVDALVRDYDKSLTRSPEKHYSKGYENHRTSSTGWMSPGDPASVFVRKRVHRLLRLPHLEYAEVPQFLRYHPGQWYRYHHDYFHNYHRLVATELVQFARSRVLELAQLNVSVDDASIVAVAARKCRAWVDASTLRDLHPQALGNHPILRAVLSSHYALPSTAARALCEEAGTSCSTVEQLDAYYSRRSLSQAKTRTLSAVLARLLAAELGLPEAASVALAAYGAADDDARLDSPVVHPPIQCNRHATLLPYLNHVERGGETVLPDAKQPAAFTRDGRYPVRQGMDECSRGVVLSPVKGGGALFYHRLGNGDLDPLSMHGGCPPEPGSVKYALNCFTWSCDSEPAMRYFE